MTPAVGVTPFYDKQGRLWLVTRQRRAVGSEYVLQAVEPVDVATFDHKYEALKAADTAERPRG